MYGKQKGNRKQGQKFSEWVQEMFPGLHERTARDAIWLAEHFSEVTSELPGELTHPVNIRAWANEQQAAKALPEDLQQVAPSPTLRLEDRDAEKVAKTVKRAESGQEGADIASR
jgi:hypothetical protein